MSLGSAITLIIALIISITIGCLLVGDRKE